MQNCRVTYIIACHNYGQYVSRAINSVARQTTPSKICVIDDGSSDDSWEKISYALKDGKHSTYEGGRITQSIQSSLGVAIRMGKCVGASEARNIAIRHAWNSDFFVILDADDEAYPEKTEKMLAIMEKHPNVGVVYADYDILNTQTGLKTREYKEPYCQARLGQECIVHSGSMIRRNHLSTVLEENASVYDKELHGPATGQFIGCCEDYDLWIRLSEKCMIYHLPIPLSLVRVTGKNQSSLTNVTNEVWQKNLQRMQEKKLARMKQA